MKALNNRTLVVAAIKQWTKSKVMLILRESKVGIRGGTTIGYHVQGHLYVLHLS